MIAVLLFLVIALLVPTFFTLLVATIKSTAGRSMLISALLLSLLAIVLISFGVHFSSRNISLAVGLISFAAVFILTSILMLTTVLNIVSNEAYRTTISSIVLLFCIFIITCVPLVLLVINISKSNDIYHSFKNTGDIPQPVQKQVQQPMPQQMQRPLQQQVQQPVQKQVQQPVQQQVPQPVQQQVPQPVQQQVPQLVPQQIPQQVQQQMVQQVQQPMQQQSMQQMQRPMPQQMRQPIPQQIRRPMPMPESMSGSAYIRQRIGRPLQEDSVQCKTTCSNKSGPVNVQNL